VIFLLLTAFFALPSAGRAVEVTGTGKARPIEPGIVGYNSESYYSPNLWANSNRRKAAAAVRPGMLRYPGGTAANYWDAYHSRMFRDRPEVSADDGNPADSIRTRYTIGWVHKACFWLNPAPLSDYRRLLADLEGGGRRAPGTVFVANMVTPGADYFALKWHRAVNRTPGGDDWWAMLGTRYGALDYMLRDAAKNGIPVRYVEFGNEYYFGAGRTHTDGPADVEPYVAGGYEADNRDAFEDIGTFPGQSGGKDRLYLCGVAANDWATKIKKDRPGVKVCAVGAFVDRDGYERRTAQWNATALAALDPAKVDAVSLHVYGGPQSGSLTGTEDAFGESVGSWVRFWTAGFKRSNLPARFDLWVTEFNIADEFSKSDKLPESKGTWGNGLGNIYCLHHWLATEPRVKIALLHELARAIVGDGPAIRPHARAYALFAGAADGHTRARPVALKGAPLLTGAQGAFPGVVGWVFDSADEDRPARCVFVNFTDAKHSLTGLGRVLPQAPCRTLQATASRAATTDPGETTRALTDADRQWLELPPRSVTEVEVRPRVSGNKGGTSS
jgi:hypothetical protein